VDRRHGYNPLVDRSDSEQTSSLEPRASSLGTAPVGVFGGTFDPIHYGHLRLAEELADRLALAEVRIIPARVPPHRGTPRVTSIHRLAMARLACAGNPRFRVDDRECRRDGASYTVDTLIELRKELGSDIPLALLMGVDAYLALTSWSRWERLFDLAHVVIAHRPGFELDTGEMPALLAEQTAARLLRDARLLRAHPAGGVLAVDIPPLDISGTSIRAALREGRSARYLLPDSVLDYIGHNHLYKELDAA
jgi:nicotinate-nucleotide adenylyltransferase